MADAAVTPGSRSFVAASTEGAAGLASRHRTDENRSRLSPGLIIRRLVQAGEVNWLVKNPDTGKLLSFDEANWSLIELFDGSRTPLEIVDEYNQRYRGSGIGLETVTEYEDALRKMDLLEKSTAERNLQLLDKVKNARKRAAEEKAEGFNIFFIMFHVIDPDRFLERTQKYVRWIWTPPTVAVFAVAAAITVGIFARDFGTIWAQTIELYSFLRKPFWDAVQFFFILTLIGGIHEFSHGYTTKFYGGEVHDIGLALYYFTPAFYCDTTDHLMFPNKSHRLWVTFSGIYIESILCCIATFLWVATYPDTLLHELAYKTMLYTGVSTVFFNINPLIKTDGYHALTSVLEMPELREESFQYLGALIQRKVLRLGVDVPVHSRRKRRAYFIYGVLSMAYTAMVMYLIGHLFFNLYSRLFPDFALVLLIVTLYRIFRQRVRVVMRTAKLVYLDKKELLMSRRSRIPLLAGAAILLILLAAPWFRDTITVDAVLEPSERVRLDAPETAVIDRFEVAPGQTVKQGQVIARMASSTLENELLTLNSERGGFAKQAANTNDGISVAGMYEAQRHENALVTDVAAAKLRQEGLVLRSPFAGRVLTPRIRDLEGRLVRAGTPLLQIGNCETLIADLSISERLVSDVQPGDDVAIQLHTRPLKLVHGVVASISPATAEGVAEHPDQPIVAKRPERFLVTVTFDNSDGKLLPGMTGVGKIYTRRRSFIGRSGRILYRWVRTVIW